MNSLFFCSPIGLGHAARGAAIAAYFENRTKFVTGGTAVDFFKSVNLDAADMYFPPRFRVEDGTLKKSLRWLWQYYRYYKECKKAAECIVKNEMPDMIVSDEDFASLTVAQERKIPNVLITDILETKFTRGIGSLVEKKMNGSMKEIISRCEAVILPEEGDDEGNIKRVGPIVRGTRFSREELRGKLGFSKETIVISVGGTDAGSFLIERALRAAKRVKKDREVVVVSGPSLSRQQRDGIRDLGFVDNLHEVIFASDLVISLAGKSTIDEANAYGTPGIFIPIKNHFEQEDNARGQGFSYEDVFRLEGIIEEKISLPRRGRTRADGAQKAWDIIKGVGNIRA